MHYVSGINKLFSPAVTWGWGKGGSLSARLGPEAEKGGGDGEAGPACAWEARAPHKMEWNANARLIAQQLSTIFAILPCYCDEVAPLFMYLHVFHPSRELTNVSFQIIRLSVRQ